jgi:excinuclease UvrABC nuclease subunit
MDIDREFFLKDYPCIYYLYDREKIVYIGRSRRPSDRLMAHSRSNKIFDSVKITKCNECDMYKLEKIEIKNHQPKYNMVGK